MHSVLTTLATMILAIAARPLAPPATGWPYNPAEGQEFIFPLTATQCEPFYIWYNVTRDNFFTFLDASFYPSVSFTFPQGVGYLEWICNIPAGVLIVSAVATLIRIRDAPLVLHPAEYVVQPGSSSDCLGDVTTTYSLLNYGSGFASYTQTASRVLTTPPALTPLCVFLPACRALFTQQLQTYH
jgi:hypothetical protein